MPVSASAASASTQPVGTNDGGERPVRCRALRAGLQPVTQSSAVVERAFARGIGRRIARVAIVKGRIGKDVIESATKFGRHGKNVAIDETDAIVEPVVARILIGERHQSGVDLKAHNARAGNATRHAQACGTAARSQFEDLGIVPRRDCSGQHHGIETGAKSGRELAHFHF